MSIPQRNLFIRSVVPAICSIAVVLILFLSGCSQADSEGVRPMKSPPDTLYSFILENGMVYDGTGSKPVKTDVGVIGDQIIAFGDLSGFRSEVRYNIEGLVVTPGFIDIHSHAAGSRFEGSGLHRYPDAENYIRQGVTTVIVGQDGSSAYPIAAYLKKIEGRKKTINIGTMVGHGTIRAYILGNRDRKPTDSELEKMKSMVEQAMKDGAFGLSSGLEYTPGAYSETEELIELTRMLKPFGGIYISHIRNEGAELLKSVEETIRIGEAAGVAPHITHHKVVGKSRWGNSAKSLRMIEEARERGVDVMSDVYPYTASSTGINILFPAWSKEGSRSERLERLRDPEKRIFIRNDIAEHIKTERGGDPSSIVVANCSWNRQLNGKSLADILNERNKEPSILNTADLAMELEEKGGCMGVFHSMSEDDVVNILQHPTTMVASDGGIPGMDVGAPHPRNYGSFARIIARYVREVDALSMQEAVHKMSGLPASRLGLRARGILQEGFVADLVVMDPEQVEDHASFESPHQYATGLVHVFVSGKGVLLNGEMTNERPGNVLRKEF